MSRFWFSCTIVLLPATVLAQAPQLVSRLPQPFPVHQQGPPREPVQGRPETLPDPVIGRPGRQELTLADAEGIALANSPTLARAGAMIEAAQGRWFQAGRYPNPRVGYSASEIGNEGRQGQQGLFFSQEFVTGGKIGLNREVANQEIRLAQRRLVASRFRVLTDVHIAFYNVLVSQRRVQIASQLVAIGEKGVKTAEALLKAQEVSRADVLRARVESDTAKIVLSTSQFAMLASWRELAAVMAAPDMPLNSAVGNLDDGFPQFTWGTTLDRLLAHSPEMAMATTRVGRARWAVSRARVQPIPNITLQATVQQDTSTNDTVTGIQATIPITVFNANQGKIRASHSEFFAAQRNVERVALALQHRLATVFAQYEGAQRAASRYKNDILPNSNQTLELITAGYKQGEFKYTDLLSVQRTYFQANLTYLDAVRELRTAIARIEGLLLTGSLRD